MAGRKSKFNEKICKELCMAHENGLPANSCAAFVGITRQTLHNWLKKGREAKSGKFKEFYLQWEKAKIKFELYHLKKINDAKDWRASQYLLSVTNPEQYNTHNWHKVEAKVDANVNLQQLFSDELLDDVIGMTEELDERKTKENSE